jgi:hypothetical protein
MLAAKKWVGSPHFKLEADGASSLLLQGRQTGGLINAMGLSKAKVVYGFPCSRISAPSAPETIAKPHFVLFIISLRTTLIMQKATTHTKGVSQAQGALNRLIIRLGPN